MKRTLVFGIVLLISAMLFGQAPTANPQTITIAEDSQTGITLTGSDPNNDPLTYTVTIAPQHGTLSGSAPNLTYSPSANYAGTDSFEFIVNDGNQNSAPATISITIFNVNDPPTANAASYSMQEDGILNLLLSGNDIEGDPLTYIIVSGPSVGNLTGSGSNRNYYPPANYYGVVSFTFRVNDGHINGDSPIATVTISVASINDAPVAIGQSITTNEDTPISILLSGSDVDGDPLTFIGVLSPSVGTLTGTAPNLLYTPPANYSGSTSFTFRVRDPSLATSAMAIVSITVVSVNDAPTANDDNGPALIEDGSNGSINIISNDSDIEGIPNPPFNNYAPGTYLVDLDLSDWAIQTTFTDAQGVWTFDNATGVLTYDPATNYYGTASIAYRLQDLDGGSDSANITFVVTPVNDVPLGVNDNVTTPEDTPVLIAVLANDSDIDATLDLSSIDLDVYTPGVQALYTMPGQGTFSVNHITGIVTFSPAANFSGTVTHTYIFCDNGTPMPSACDDAIITVVVTPVNDPPVALCQNLNLYLNGSGTASLIPAMVNAGSYDIDDGIASMSLSVSSLNCTNMGSNTVILTVTDISGASSTCNAVVNVIDSTGPVFTCPTSISANVGNTNAACGTPVSYAMPTATDNCGSVTVLQTTGLPSGSTFPIGTTTNTFTATDGSGNTSTCSFDVTVQAPEINVKGNNTNITNGDLTPSFTDHTDVGSVLECTGTIVRTYTVENIGNATLNTGAVTITGTHASDFSLFSTTLGGPMPPGGSGTVTIRFDATAVGLRSAMISIGNDDCNESPFSFAVQGTGNADVISPVFTSCPGTTTVNAISGQCHAVVNFATPAATDNCVAGLTVTQIAGLPSGSNFPVGANTVTFRATDASGNFTDCTFQINVHDNTPPTATCSNITTYVDASGNATIDLLNLGIGSSDNCACIALREYDLNNDGTYDVTASGSVNQTFSCPAGVRLIPVRVTDCFGLNSVCVAQLTVLDTIRPVVNCQNITTYLNSSGTSNAFMSLVLGNTAVDNCNSVSLAFSQTIFNCNNVGTNNITVTGTDDSGNSSSCISTVTVIDTIRPIANCQNITVHLSTSGSAGILPIQLDAGSSDACGIASRTLSQSTFTCANVGTNNVTLTVTDVNGNSSTCTSVVTVVDTVRPVANCINRTFMLNNTTGTLTIGGAWINNGSSDACGIASMTASPSTFTCANVGANNVTLTVTDVNGNSSVCTAIVTILDTMRPNVVTQNITVTLSNGTASITPAMINNGSSDVCGIASMTVSPNTFNCSNLGANTVTLTVTDVNGNTQTGTAVVTVLSDLATVVQINSNVNCFGGSNGQATAIVTGGAAPFSYSWTPSGGTNAIATGLSAGVYTCTVTDNGGCQASAAVVITQPATPVSVSLVSQTNVSCNAGNNGSATVNATGGTPNYTYSWAPTGGNTSSATGLSAGTYTVTVTDNNNCLATQTVTITQPLALVASAAAQTNVSCNGGNNGTASVAVSGGTMSYSYNWTPGNPTGDGTASVIGLTAGTYTCTVTDANSCVTTQTFNITQPPVLTASAATQSNVSCFGGNDGSATVNASGGTPNYTYSWAPTGGTAATASGLSAGTYTCTVTDANSCVTTQTFNITQPPALTASAAAQSNVSCFGGNDGSATVNASGGTPNYTYAWAPAGGNATTASGLSAGTYTCTVTDANNCMTSQSFTIAEPAELIASHATTTLLCNGDTAAVTITATGGTPSYIGTGTFYEVAGTYSYTVTDSNGCLSTTNVTITAPAAINVTVATTNVLCNGDSTGSIDLTVTGGTGSYTYDWNNGQYITEDLFNIPAGTYSGILTDANGCQDSGTIVINEPLPLQISSNTINPSGCTIDDGSISTTISGGTPGYTYLWNTGDTTATISSLADGTYSVTVTDTNSCVITSSFTLTDPAPPAVTFTTANDTVCQSTTASFVLTGGSPFGGLYSGSGVVNDTTFDPMAAIIGYNVITYTYTDTNGCSASAIDSIYVDLCLGISAATEELQVLIYPNPNNGNFTIQTTSYADVLIFDAQGKLLHTEKVQPRIGHQFSIEASGIYLITVIDNQGRRNTQRVLVNK